MSRKKSQTAAAVKVQVSQVPLLHCTRKFLTKKLQEEKAMLEEVSSSIDKVKSDNHSDSSVNWQEINNHEESIARIKNMLSGPTIKGSEQTKVVEYGNGVIVNLFGEDREFMISTVVPDKHPKIISAYAPFGTALLGKKKGEKGHYTITEARGKDKGKQRKITFEVKEIHPHSVAKNLLKEGEFSFLVPS